MPTPAEVKKALVSAGFVVYRTRGDLVHVAERARENLIMDAGIRVRASEPAVILMVRAQRSDFPHEPEGVMFEHARKLAKIAIERGYVEVGTQITPLPDPNDESHTLDSWFEVSYEKRVADLEQAMTEVAFALSIEKAASRT
ncbi:MAG: hypothetical protein IPM54_35545 [Polyangiaceae bacterium]|nr:hypothetical protein [Polyangiaceae bacterium]